MSSDNSQHEQIQRQVPVTGPLGAVLVALIAVTALRTAFLPLQGLVTLLLAMLVNRLTASLPGALQIAEPGISWRFIGWTIVLAFTLFAAAFLVGGWLYPSQRQAPPAKS